MTSAAARLKDSLADRYTIEGEIGHGGMADVFLAEDRKHDRKVAIKVFRAELSALLGADRFLNEIKVTANLQHPHILPLYDSGSAEGLLYYVMPYVEGETLRDRLNEEKQLPVAEAVATTRAVASALDYAHRHGVVHRDIKPENILLHDGQALVADFGIALAVSEAGGDLSQDGKFIVYYRVALVVQNTGGGVAGPLYAVDLETGERTPLLETSVGGAWYAGHETLVYTLLDGLLYGVQFDPDRLVITGEAVPIGGPTASLLVGLSRVSVSRTGSVLYAPQRGAELVVVTSGGARRALLEEFNEYGRRYGACRMDVQRHTDRHRDRVCQRRRMEHHDGRGGHAGAIARY